ncbi:hypothetical protein C6571_12495 [Simplicispira suum]|uniref:Uncharacterized protein n=1 Tax=Simplicispira suum TaxID=2109915 RepID=A0A2S0N1G5_9BURK|nr:hypothetical protein C6571_12495 [Simplicispira suum]
MGSARESAMHAFEQKMRQPGARLARHHCTTTAPCRTAIARRRTSNVHLCTPLGHKKTGALAERRFCY